MALLDRNGIKLEVGQTVKMLFPGTSDECVGQVVAVGTNHADVEAIHYGSRQSFSVSGGTVETVVHDRVATFEIELARAQNDLENTNGAVASATTAVADAKLGLANAQDALKRAQLALKDVSKRADEMAAGLAQAKQDVKAEDERNAALAADPSHIGALNVQVTTAPIINTPLQPALPLLPDPTVTDPAGA